MLNTYSSDINRNLRDAVLMIHVKELCCNKQTRTKTELFHCLCLKRNEAEGKEMLKVTPKLGLGKQQAKPKCLTNRQQIELHTAYSESTLCNLNWALCLHLPRTRTHS